MKYIDNRNKLEVTTWLEAEVEALRLDRRKLQARIDELERLAMGALDQLDYLFAGKVGK